MKKLLLFLLFLVLAISFVNASELTILSGTGTQYRDGNSWSPAVPVTYIHPSWSSYIPSTTMPDAVWVWNSEGVTVDEAVHGSRVLFMHEFDLPRCSRNFAGILQITTDNAFTLRVNSDTNYTDSNWMDLATYNIGSSLKSGNNAIVIDATNEAMVGGTPETNPAGVIYKVYITYDTYECGNNDITPGPEQVPEFGVVAGAVALIGALGIFMYRRN